VKFRYVVFEIFERNRQVHRQIGLNRHANRNTLHLSRGQRSNNNNDDDNGHDDNVTYALFESLKGLINNKNTQYHYHTLNYFRRTPILVKC